MSPDADHFLDHGSIVRESGFDPALIDRLRHAFEARFEGRDTDGAGLELGERRTLFSAPLSGPFLDPAVYAHPAVMAIVTELLGTDIVIDSATVAFAGAGAPDQRLHRDYSNLFPTVPPAFNRMAAFALNVAIPLIDLDEATGTTRFYPGTHATPMPSEDAPSETPYLKRGGFLVMDYCLYHRGTANRSDRGRPILYLTYARAWFIDPYNYRGQPRLDLKAEDFAGIAKEHRPLFRRLAAKGAYDCTERELLGQ